MPSNLPAPLHALWIEARGNWDHAHRLVQDEPSAEAAWVHAYLHRKEGDASNAGYWYAKAGRDRSVRPLEREWDEIASTLLAARN